MPLITRRTNPGPRVTTYDRLSASSRYRLVLRQGYVEPGRVVGAPIPWQAARFYPTPPTLPLAEPFPVSYTVDAALVPWGFPSLAL